MLATSTTQWMSVEMSLAATRDAGIVCPIDWSAVPDVLLVRACATHDHEAFAELVRRYQRPLLKAARRLMGNDEDASDATQQTLLQAYLALPSSRLDLPVRPWLFRILRNQCFDRLRRKEAIPFSRLTSTSDAEDGPPIDAPDARPLPDELAEQSDLRQAVEWAIATLPARYRPVVSMRYADDLSFAEIAAQLHVPEPTARTLFQRAKAMMRQALAVERTDSTGPAHPPAALPIAIPSMAM